jgi:hypothetical protein
MSRDRDKLCFFASVAMRDHQSSPRIDRVLGESEPAVKAKLPDLVWCADHPATASRMSP